MAEIEESGFLKFLGGPGGSLLGIGVGGLLKGLGGLIGGGGRRRRVKDLERFATELEGREQGENELTKFAALQEKALLPQLNRLGAQASERVGLGSGIGQGFILNRISELTSRGLVGEQDRINRFNENLFSQIGSIKGLLAQLG